jgi:hypothetical protein
MKNIKRLVYGLALSLALGTRALGQPGGPGSDQPGGGPGPFGHRHHAPSVAMLATNYAALAPFDTNHAGTLDTSAQAAVAQALVAGTLQLPGPGHGPDEDRAAPSADAAKHIVKHLAALYAALAPYDTDKNGQLDSSEQAAVSAALANGTLKLPRPGGPGGGGRGGPPPGDNDEPSQ